MSLYGVFHLQVDAEVMNMLTSNLRFIAKI